MNIRISTKWLCVLWLITAAQTPARAQDVEILDCSSAVKSDPDFAASRLAPAELPIGTILTSILDKKHFPCTVGGTWALAAGGKVATRTKFAILVRQNLTVYAPLVRGNDIYVPDLRGVFLRGKNYDRALNEGNVDGDLALGSQQGDDIGQHRHPYIRGYADAGVMGSAGDGNWHGTAGGITAGVESDGFKRAETRPRNVTVNFYIRID